MTPQEIGALSKFTRRNGNGKLYFVSAKLFRRRKGKRFQCNPEANFQSPIVPVRESLIDTYKEICARSRHGSQDDRF